MSGHVIDRFSVAAIAGTVSILGTFLAASVGNELLELCFMQVSLVTPLAFCVLLMFTDETPHNSKWQWRLSVLVLAINILWIYVSAAAGVVNSTGPMYRLLEAMGATNR